MLASPRGRFVATKSEETQGAAAVFRVRELLIRQRTQTINALRGHLAEFGEVVPQGVANARRLIALVEAEDAVLPKTMQAALSVLVTILRHLEERIEHHTGPRHAKRRIRGRTHVSTRLRAKCHPKKPLAFGASTHVASQRPIR